jgi:hypothetical protein
MDFHISKEDLTTAHRFSKEKILLPALQSTLLTLSRESRLVLESGLGIVHLPAGHTYEGLTVGVGTVVMFKNMDFTRRRTGTTIFLESVHAHGRIESDGDLVFRSSVESLDSIHARPSGTKIEFRESVNVRGHVSSGAEVQFVSGEVLIGKSLQTRSALFGHSQLDVHSMYEVSPEKVVIGTLNLFNYGSETTRHVDVFTKNLHIFPRVMQGVTVHAVNMAKYALHNPDSTEVKLLAEAKWNELAPKYLEHKFAETRDEVTEEFVWV